MIDLISYVTCMCVYIYMRVVLYSFIYKPSLGRPCAKLARRLRDSGFWINQCLRYHELGHTAQEEKKKQQEKKTNKEKKKKEETKRKKTQDRKGKEKQRHEKIKIKLKKITADKRKKTEKY